MTRVRTKFNPLFGSPPGVTKVVLWECLRFPVFSALWGIALYAATLGAVPWLRDEPRSCISAGQLFTGLALEPRWLPSVGSLNSSKQRSDHVDLRFDYVPPLGGDEPPTPLKTA